MLYLNQSVPQGVFYDQSALDQIPAGTFHDQSKVSDDVPADTYQFPAGIFG